MNTNQAQSGEARDAEAARAASELEIVGAESSQLPAKRGRPAKGLKGFAPTTQTAILANLANGLTPAKALIAAGVDPERVETSKESDPVLWSELEQERARAESRLLAEVRAQAGVGMKAADSTPAAWVLKHYFGAGKTDRIELTGKDGGPILQLTLAKTLVQSMGAAKDSRAG